MNKRKQVVTSQMKHDYTEHCRAGSTHFIRSTITIIATSPNLANFSGKQTNHWIGYGRENDRLNYIYDCLTQSLSPFEGLNGLRAISRPYPIE